MGLYKRVILLLLILVASALLVIGYIQNRSVSRLYAIYNPSETEKELVQVRGYLARDYSERIAQNRPVQDIKRLTSVIENRILNLEELEILNRELKYKIIFSSTVIPVLIFIVFFITGLYLLKNLFRPIKILTHSMSRYSEGDESVFPQPVSGIPESRMLLENTNSMIETIRKQKITITAQQRFLGWKIFAREIVHEIKNILTPARLSAEALLESASDNGFNVLKTDIKNVLDSLSSLERMSKSLKDLSDMRLPLPENFSLLEMAAESVNFYSKQFPDIMLAGDNVAITADRELIKSALNNLIVNSIDAVKGTDCGRILVRVGFSERAFVECADNGCGIPDDNITKIFHLNFTTKENGNGFGLYYVKKILGDNGYSIEVNSGLDGSGVTMRMVF